jgi:predicted alpha-1,2-mannosidase
LTKYGIKTEATASPHGGILRFTFPANEQSRIQIDLARRVGGTSTWQYAEVVDDNTIRGYMKCTPDGGGWGNGDGHPDYVVYFYAKFSEKITDYGFWSADIPDTQKRKLEDVTSDAYQAIIANSKVIRNEKKLEGKHIGFFTEFPTKANEEVTMNVGISFTDLEGAEKNFNAELKNKKFDQILDQTKSAWNNVLNKIEIEGGTDDMKTVFYTALYHTMIDPRDMSDVDGRYPGPNGKIYQSENFTKRTIFSGWDVFRSQFPLQTIINPTLVNDEINSLVTLSEQSGKGYLERWEFFNAYSGCMVGNPAISLIADAYMKNIRDYDIDKAYKAAIHTSELIGNGGLGYTPKEKGYSVSETLEYAYTDWCVAQLAKALGKSDDEKKYTERAKYYKNIFDADTMKWFRSRLQNGDWEKMPEGGRMTEWYGCVESNPYQQGWFVPHDIDGMVELMGGKDAVIADLKYMFENTPEDYAWNGYYNHANEPVHHIPFLFNWLGVPHLTQKHTRHICKHAYKNEVKGLIGNEDVGQMSAWYILAASGIHPICPGETIYEITSPVFDKITYRLEDGKKFTIIAKNNSDKNIYIAGMTLNGKPYDKYYIDHFDIVKGGTLVLEMTDIPVVSH